MSERQRLTIPAGWTEGECINYHLYKDSDDEPAADIMFDVTVIKNCPRVKALTTREVTHMICDLAMLLRQMQAMERDTGVVLATTYDDSTEPDQ